MSGNHGTAGDAQILKEGSFYRITGEPDRLVLLDKTKRGLETRELTVDEKTGANADKGIIYDMDGIGHLVPIRWYFERARYDLPTVAGHAEDMEKRYADLRELTCPDG